MSRALWIAFAAVFASLLLYLAFVGHREQVVRVTSAMPDVFNGLTTLVDRMSQPGKKQISDGGKIVEPKQHAQKLPQELSVKKVHSAQKPALPENSLKKQVAVSNIELSNVEYDKKGRLVLTGRAGSAVHPRFFIDGITVKLQKMQADGRWKIIVPEEVAAGQHRLEASMAGRLGGAGIIVVMPFVKAGPEEIAALATSRQRVEVLKTPDDLKVVSPKNAPVGSTQKPAVVARNNIQREPDLADLPLTRKEPARKTSPGFSKLAELARSQSVKRDVDPLIGLLPRLMIGDGPLLVKPEIPASSIRPGQPDDAVKPDRVQTVKPVPEARKKQPVSAAPPEQAGKGVQESPVKPAASTLAAVKKLQPAAPTKRSLNKGEVNKPAIVRPARKRSSTGYQKVKVAAGKGLVVVQPGNTLWDLAISIYGSGRYYKKLYRANRRRIKNPQMIYPGQIIFAPDANPPASIKPLSPPQWAPPQ